MVDDEPERAKDAINRLSSLLRSSLSLAKSKTVNLIVEIQTVKNYIELEQIRFEERLNFHYQVEDKTVYLPVPPMMLQTLVENAVKHGISKQKNGGSIELKSFIEKGWHIIQIRNTGQLPDNVDGKGYGIANTRERLRLVFGGKAMFSLQNETPLDVLTEIKIPLYESSHRG
jgi:LytS/YehU family sensor histidine kinase